MATRSMSMSSRSMYGGSGNVQVSIGGGGGSGSFGRVIDWSQYAQNAASGGGGAGGGGGGGGSGGSMDISANEKGTMQNLNDRLASYLEKVRKLEEANAALELKIKGFVQSKLGGAGGAGGKDYSSYYSAYAELQEQIVEAVKVNSAIYLSIDNATLAAEDFRIKWENELAMRMSVEADIAGLRKVLDELTMGRSDLEMTIEGLREELVFLKKDQEDQMAAMAADVGGSLDVKLDAAQGPDLASLLNAIREQCEADAERDRKKLAAWFEAKSAGLAEVVAEATIETSSTKSEITDLKRMLQALEIELQSQLSMKGSLENTLAETQSRYAMQLNGYQNQVMSMEEQLMSMRESIEQQKQEYEILLDIKTRLEMEIAEYRRLLDGEGGGSGGGGGGYQNGAGFAVKSSAVSVSIPVPVPSPTTSAKRTQKKVVTVIEEIIDGKVVSTTQSEIMET